MDELIQELTNVLKQQAPPDTIVTHLFDVLSELGYSDDAILEIADDLKALVY